MIWQLKILTRNFVKKPVYSLITFLGFTLGVMASLLIYLWVINELSYEKFHPAYDRIYRVLTLVREGDEIVKSAGCYRPLAKTLKAAFPQIENATYLSFDSEDSPLSTGNGGDKIEARGMNTNDDFFAVFGGFKFTEGMPGNAFSNPLNIVLSEDVAKKLFGNKPALGKNLISDKYNKEVYTVSGVVRIPRQSHIDFGYILPERSSHYARLANDWGDKAYVHVYIKLAENAVVDAKFLDEITNYPSHVSRFQDKLLFQLLTDIHLHTDYPTYIFDKNISSYKYVLIFSTLAVLILLMAALNFSILSVARSSERSTEIGLKKVCGAGRTGITLQFMAESILQTTGATLLALFLIWIILPWFNGFAGQDLSLGLSPGFICSLFLLTLLAGILAGLYPSLYLSSLKPLNIFRGGSRTGSKEGFTRLLIVFQFSIATFFIIASTVFVKQLNYINGKDLGFDRNNIVVIPTGLWYENKTFKNELLRNPDILSVSATTYAPVDFSWQGSFAVEHGNRIDSIRASMYWVDEDFAKTYRLQVTKGRFLQMDYEAFWKTLKTDTGGKKPDRAGFSFPVVINETAEKALRFENPIGQKIGEYVIVGVVKDFHFRPLQYAIGPLIMTNDPQNIMTMNVRISGKNKAETLKFIRETYRKNRDSRSFSYSYFADLISQKYQDDIRLRNLTLVFSFFAIIISMLGILGMAVYSCERRTREIGIRKANGASSLQILFMLNADFLKWIAIAVLIASPVAWIILNRWLEGFAYRTALSWWIFILAAFLSMAVAVLAISWQTIRVASGNPVNALRNE
ncbi:MAG: ABC transporter permease [Bacteroidetes bacterium]|nr:ABC transporter permease [Bacteroidota bacterium]